MTPGVPGLGYATGNHGKCAACWKGQTVSTVGDDMNVCDVCRSFDSHVRIQVEDSQGSHRDLNMLI